MLNTVIINDQTIVLVSKIQRFAYRCIELFGENSPNHFTTKSKQELMAVWGEKLFKDELYEIVYDETIWQPDDLENYGQIVRLILKHSFLGYITTDINFNKPDHEIFNVKYTWEEHK